jgi:hypothetical protein
VLNYILKNLLLFSKKLWARKSRFNTLLFFFISSVFVFVLLELSFLLLHNIGLISHEKSHLIKFYKENAHFQNEEHSLYFCDFIHKTELGHQKLSHIIDSQILFGSHESIVFLGGSTTRGGECGLGERNYTDFLGEKNSQLKIVNLSAPGKNSDYSLLILEKELVNGFPLTKLYSPILLMRLYCVVMPPIKTLVS